MMPGDAAGDRLVIPWNNVDFAFRWCPPTVKPFKMGSPASETPRFDDENQVEVTLTHGFWMLETPVTQGMWLAVLGAERVKKWDVGAGDDLPVYYVDWNEAKAFCVEFTAQVLKPGRTTPDWKLDLPTEAQWEYACRAGMSTRFNFGDEEAELGEYAWYGENSGGMHHPVRSQEPNNWGLHDVHGTVWEWTDDWYTGELIGGSDPRGPSASSYRVYRGGSCWNDLSDCRSAYRLYSDPSWSADNLGFRPLAVPVR